MEHLGRKIGHICKKSAAAPPRTVGIPMASEGGHVLEQLNSIEGEANGVQRFIENPNKPEQPTVVREEVAAVSWS